MNKFKAHLIIMLQTRAIKRYLSNVGSGLLNPFLPCSQYVICIPLPFTQHQQIDNYYTTTTTTTTSLLLLLPGRRRHHHHHNRHQSTTK